MRVKLHKGPMHGKTYEVPDGRRDILFNAFGGTARFDLYTNNPKATLEFATVRYSMKMMKHHLFGYYPATDPDGRIFFEYAG